MKKSIGFKLIIATLLISTISVMFTGCFGSEIISLNDYITISTEGYDTLGTASFEFDYDAFCDDCDDIIELKKNSSVSKRDLRQMDLNEVEYFCKEVIHCSLSQTSDLSNGNTIVLSWDCDDEFAKEEYGCKLKYSDITYTVQDLQQVNTFDPFEYVDVTFDGYAPNGKATISRNSYYDVAYYLSFDADKTEGLSNNDTVTVTATLSCDIDYCINTYGMIPSTTTKTYTVSGLSSYVTKIEDIDATSLEAMKTQATDSFRADVADDWDDPDSLSEITYAGYYLLTAKPDIYTDHDNKLYLMFKVDAIGAEGTALSYYYFIRYCDILVDASNKTSYDAGDYRLCGTFLYEDDCFKFEGKYYDGYQTLKDFENDIIIPEIEKFQYTTDLQS